MIYVDTSVVLAALLAEDRRPPPEFWAQHLISSRLLEFETWTRLHAERPGEEVAQAARFLVGSADLVEMTPTVLARQGMRLQVATYDARLAAAARSVGLDVVEP